MHSGPQLSDGILCVLSTWSMRMQTMNFFFFIVFVLLFHVQTSILLKIWAADVVNLSCCLTSMFHQFILNGFDHGLCLSETTFQMALALLPLVSTDAWKISSECLSLRVKIFTRMRFVRWMKKTLTTWAAAVLVCPPGLSQCRIVFDQGHIKKVSFAALRQSKLIPLHTRLGFYKCWWAFHVREGSRPQNLLPHVPPALCYWGIVPV